MARAVSIQVSAVDEASDVFEAVEGAGKQAASEIEDSWEQVSKATEEHSQGVEDTQDTYKETESVGKRAAQSLEKNWKSLALAGAAVGYALERMARQQAEYTRELRMTAVAAGTTEEELRRMAVAVADVTRSVDDVIGSFRALRERGVENAEAMVYLTQQYDAVADALGVGLVPLIKEGADLFYAFGGDINSVAEYADELTYALHTTTLTLQDFSRLSYRGREDLDAMNLSFEEGVGVLLALEERYGSGRAATREFMDASRAAGGEQDVFLESLRLTREELEVYADQMKEAGGLTEELARIHAESFTPLQRMWSILERLQLQYGAQIEILGQLAPLMLGLIPITMALKGVWAALTVVIKAGKLPWLALAGAIAAVSAAVVGVDKVLDAISGAMDKVLDSVEDLIFGSEAFEKILADLDRQAQETWDNIAASTKRSAWDILREEHKLTLAFVRVNKLFQDAGLEFDKATKDLNVLMGSLREMTRDGVDPAGAALGLFVEFRLISVINALEDTEMKTEAFKEALILLHSALGGAHPAVKLLEEAFEDFASTIDGAGDSLKRFEDIVDDIKGEIDALTTAHEEYGIEIDLNERIVRKLEKAILTLLRAEEDYSDQLEILFDMLEEVRAGIFFAGEEALDAADKFEDLGEGTEEATRAGNEFTEITEEEKEALKGLVEELGETSKEIDGLGDYLDDTVESAEGMRDVCEDELTPALEDLTKAAGGAIKEIDGLGEAFEGLVKDAEDFEPEVASLEVEIAGLEKSLKALAFIASMYTDETFDLTDRQRELRKEFESLVHKLGPLHPLIQEMLERYPLLQDEILGTADELEGLGESTKDYVEEAEKLTETTEEEKEKFRVLIETMEDAIPVEEALEESTEEVTEATEEFGRTVKEVTRELKEAENQIDANRVIARLFEDETFSIAEAHRILSGVLSKAIKDLGEDHFVTQQVIMAKRMLGQEMKEAKDVTEVFSDEVEDVVKVLEKEDDMIQQVTEDTEIFIQVLEDAIDGTKIFGDEIGDLVEKEELLENELKRVVPLLRAMEDELKVNEIMADLLGDRTFTLADRQAIMVRVTENVIKILGEEHYITQQLIEEIQMLGTETLKTAKDVEELGDEFEDLVKDTEKLNNLCELGAAQLARMSEELRIARDMAKLLGDEEELLEKELAIKTRRLQELVRIYGIGHPEVQALAERIRELRGEIEETDQTIKTFMDGIVDGIEGLEDAAGKYEYSLGKSIVDETQRALSQIMQDWNNAGDIIMDVIDRIAAHAIDQFARMIAMELLSPFLSLAADGGGGSGEHFAGSFQFGGTVPGPPSSTRLAVVHGGETITPHGRSPSPGVVHQTINRININAVDAKSFGDYFENYLEQNREPLIRSVAEDYKDHGLLYMLFKGRR